MPTGLLSVVPLGTANLLAYAMMGLVVFFLVFGPAVAYFLWKQNKKLKPAEPESPSQSA